MFTGLSCWQHYETSSFSTPLLSGEIIPVRVCMNLNSTVLIDHNTELHSCPDDDVSG
jgi:hypothetical protein